MMRLALLQESPQRAMAPFQGLPVRPLAADIVGSRLMQRRGQECGRPAKKFVALRASPRR